MLSTETMLAIYRLSGDLLGQSGLAPGLDVGGGLPARRWGAAGEATTARKPVES